MTSTEIKTGDPKLRAFIDDAIAEADSVVKNSTFVSTLSEKAALVILDQWRRGIGTVQTSHAILLAEGVLGVPFTAWQNADYEQRQAFGWSEIPAREVRLVA